MYSGMHTSDIYFKISASLGRGSNTKSHISITFTSRAISITIPCRDATGPAGELTVELSGCTWVEERSDNNCNGTGGQELKLGSHAQHSVTISYGW
jgi:hypothetical protein